MKKWTPVILLGVAQFVMVLDATVMNVSMSTLVKDLDTSISGIQAAITVYTLTMASFMLIGAKLGDKWGLKRAFVVGSLVYGLGSFLTSIAQSLGLLMVGWSVIEGLGAVLVVPAIAALVAANYEGADRVKGFAVIGAASGVAAAAGPLIGGFMTTYLSWRYVFAGETVIMLAILAVSKRITDPRGAKEGSRIDLGSAVLSVTGMMILVLGILQSKTWGWVEAKSGPTIGDTVIAPLGISMTAWMILGGTILLWWFGRRQVDIGAAGGEPLVRVEMLRIKALRSGLAVLLSQYLVIASVFFLIPVYLQTVQGLDALETGLRILPLSVSVILFSALGSRMVARFSPRQIVRLGQLLLIAGIVAFIASIDPTLTGAAFSISMFVLGCGLGLLASQLGQVNMSAAPADASSEVGGLQGTFQNLGSSFGTALIGSVLIISLSQGAVDWVSASELPDSFKSDVTAQATGPGLALVPASDVESQALDQGLSQEQATQTADAYAAQQVESLRVSAFFLLALAVLALLFLSRWIPSNRLEGSSAARDPD